MSKALGVALLLAVAGCAGRSKPVTLGRVPSESAPAERKERSIPKGQEPPAWAVNMEFSGGELCGLGVAGAGFQDSPYPKRLSRERAVRNLAGILGTRIQEAIIDEATSRTQKVRMARVVTIDDALLKRVDDAADTEYWIDEGGFGPFVQKRFTYAKACIDTHTAATLMNVSDEKLRVAAAGSTSINPNRVPKWIDRRGQQPDGRLCNVGFSLPMFHPDKTFEAVVEDVRIKLAKTIEGLVSSYYEELAIERNGRSALAQELITVATTDAVSNGVIVTDYWYDDHGIGPYAQRRTTYGWGCVYPVDVMQATLNMVQEQAPPEDKDVFERVKERARAAFDDLDAEIEKQERKKAATGVAPAPGGDDTPPDMEQSLGVPRSDGSAE
ncbi:MAG: hypothetical protein AAF654_02505 [Myxococcota bacterium]